jgi:hypothetical protein
MRWAMLIGQTVEDANELLKNRGYFVTENTDHKYQNAVLVTVEDDKISKILAIGDRVLKNEGKD